MKNRKRILGLALVSGLIVVGCSTGDIQSRDKLNYLSASSANPLELPPDLTKRSDGDRRAINTLSQYRAKTAGGGSGLNVLPNYNKVKMEIAGDQRWIVAQLPADFVWTRAMQLFQEVGLTMESSDPQAGVAETVWAENRPDISDGYLRNFLKSAFGNFYSTPSRDKYKFRMERQDRDTVRVYITHYGMRDKASGSDNEIHKWVDRPRDPELEAEFLSRLMVKLGGSANAVATEAAHEVVTSRQDGNLLTVNRPFDSVWHQVGNILDDGATYRIIEQNAADRSYTVERTKKAKRGLKFWKGKFDADRFTVRVSGSARESAIEVTPHGDATYQQALIERVKNNLH